MAGPILENAKVVWRDTAEQNEDAIHAVINVGGLFDEDWSTLAYMALRDSAGNTIATSVGVTAYLPLLGIPWSALAALPYEPLPHSTSASYTWSSSGSTTTVSIWEALWAGAQEILDITLQHVQSALAFYVDLYEFIVESLVQFGLWIWESATSNAAWIENMVKAAGEAFGQVVDWALEFVQEVVRQAVDSILSPLLQLLGAWVAEASQRFLALSQAADTWDVQEEAMALINALLVGPLPELVFALSAAIVISLVVVGIAASVTPAGAIAVVVKGVIKELIETAVEHWIATTILLSVLVSWVLAQFPPSDQLGGTILYVIDGVWGAFMIYYAKRSNAAIGKDILGLFLTIMGTLIVVNVFPLETYTGSRVVAAVIGTALSATGLLIALKGEDVAPPPLGYVDEFLEAATLGYDLGQTGVAIQDCVSGNGC